MRAVRFEDDHDPGREARDQSQRGTGLRQRRGHGQRPGVVPGQRGRYEQHHHHHRPGDALQSLPVGVPEPPPQQWQGHQDDADTDQARDVQYCVEVDRHENPHHRVGEVRQRGGNGEPVDDSHRSLQCGQPAEPDSGQPGQHAEHGDEGDQGGGGGQQEGSHPVPAEVTHPDPHHERQRQDRGGLDRDRDGDQHRTGDMAAGEGQRYAGHHQAHHQHLVMHPAHQVNDHQGVEHADPQCHRAVGSDVTGNPRCGPDQQRQSGQHAQPQQHGSRDGVVPDDHGHELGDQDEGRPVGGGGGGPHRTHVVQQHIRVLDRPDHVRVVTVPE